MSERNKHIDDLFKDALGNHTETPPPAVWDALEERLDVDTKPSGGRPMFPYRWLWYIGALALLIASVVTVWSVTRDKEDGNQLQVVNTSKINNIAAPAVDDIKEDGGDADSSNNNSASGNTSSGGGTKGNINNKSTNNKVNSKTDKKNDARPVAQPNANNKLASLATKIEVKVSAPKVQPAITNQDASTKGNKPASTKKQSATVPKSEVKVSAPKVQPAITNQDASTKDNKPASTKKQLAAVPKSEVKVSAPKVQPAITNQDASTKGNKPASTKKQLAAVPKSEVKVSAPKVQPATTNQDASTKDNKPANTNKPLAIAPKKEVETRPAAAKKDGLAKDNTTTKKDVVEKVEPQKDNVAKPVVQKKLAEVTKQKTKVEGDAKTTVTPQAKQKKQDNKTTQKKEDNIVVTKTNDSSALDPLDNGGDLTPTGDYKSWKGRKRDRMRNKKVNKDKNSRNSKFAMGINFGYEYGFNNQFKANKIVIAPYVQYNVTSKFSLLFQPAYLSGSAKAGGLSSGNELYYNVINAAYDSVSTIFKEDTSQGPPPPPPRIDTLKTTYTYKRTYDSTVVSQQFSQKKLWEAELPLMVQYKVSPNFSVFGGISVSFSKVLRIEEKREDYTGLSDSLQTTNVLLYNRNQGPSPPPSAQDPNAVFSGYTGKPISSYTPSAPTSTANMFTRFGYAIGFNTTIRGRYMIGLSLQQKFANSTQIPNESLRKIYTQPYLRMTIGYKIFR